jgi:hypothetical protein
VHLAAAWARWGPAPVLLLDLAGGLAFRLDLVAVPTWSTLVPATGRAVAPGALAPEVPDMGALEPGLDPGALAMDALDPGVPDAHALDQGGLDPGILDERTLDRHPLAAPSLDAGTLLETLAQPWAGLSVLPLAGPADGAPDPPPEPSAVQSVLEVARTAFRVVVVDLPATDGPVVRTVLSQADALIAVGRCETAGVRGLQVALEEWTAAGHDPDAAGAVVTGVRPQAPLAPREVRATLGDRLWALVPAAAEDGVLLLDRHDLSAVQAMVTLANRVIPFATVSA